MCLHGLGWISFFGSIVLAHATKPGATLSIALCGLCFISLIATVPPVPMRARRYGVASDTLDVAIVKYEVSPDRPETSLNDAARWAHEYLRIERVRIAPEWIRRSRRSLTLRLFAWFGPALLALAVAVASSIFEWPRVRHWHPPLVCLLALLFAKFTAGRLFRAWDILNEAIRRYEYESAGGDESALVEAGQRASSLAK